jgi:hypothetical protein
MALRQVRAAVDVSAAARLGSAVQNGSLEVRP